jgi:hypothetical protein
MQEDEDEAGVWLVIRRPTAGMLGTEWSALSVSGTCQAD